MNFESITYALSTGLHHRHYRNLILIILRPATKIILYPLSLFLAKSFVRLHFVVSIVIGITLIHVLFGVHFLLDGRELFLIGVAS